MAGAGSKVKWEASSVMEKEIKDLRSAGYLAADIKHRLPTKVKSFALRSLANGSYSFPTSLEG